MVVIFFLIHFISSPHGCIWMPQERHPIATLFVTLCGSLRKGWCAPVGYRGASAMALSASLVPAAPSTFLFRLGNFESPLHTGCLVKSSRLSCRLRNRGYLYFIDYLAQIFLCLIISVRSCASW